ncbi:NECAP-like protein [Cladobotryum mycophilum]|uniref:NECAP-like protein n=1 Tax=Cladobotryum mycophilum TaxID=491253 RepID=A0ABR0SGT1_9HYPO
MELQDPTTGRALPSDAIQRVLFVANNVHVYNIPPLTSMKGHSASSWTEDPSRHIFTARLRVVETSLESADAAASVKIDLVLEDPNSGQLFAAAPYTDRNAVESVLDSSRFFALTVRDDQGRKAVLGIGFEERSEAFDLSVSLQEARRSLGLDGETNKPADKEKKTEAKDYSLKEGETITVNLGGSSKFGRRRPQQSETSSASGSVDLQSFALAPPPGAASASSGSAGASFALPPPPSASDVKQKRRSLRDMGFDDGKFGEFA